MRNCMDYPDIFFTPEYVELFRKTSFGGFPTRFTCSGIDYRFFVRDVIETDYKDIISPYGYSGAVEVSDDVDWWQFSKEFHKYCLQENIITEFARLHPFIGNHIPFQYLNGNVFLSGDVVYIDLSQTEDVIWGRLDKGCKSAIKKAGRDCVRTLDNFTVGDFQDVYFQTMTRRDASQDYFFDDRFFEQLSTLPGIILGAFHNGQLVSAVSILAYGDYAHYFLSGSTLEHRSLNGNNLLLWEAVKWAKYHGCKIFNVGGTIAGNKALGSFKKSFSPLTKPFYTYRMVHNVPVYQELCKQKGVYWDSEGYFPAYRR